MHTAHHELAALRNARAMRSAQQTFDDMGPPDDDGAMTEDEARDQAELEWLSSPRAIANAIDADVSEAEPMHYAGILARIRGGGDVSTEQALVAVMHCGRGDAFSVVLALRGNVERLMEPSIKERAAELLAAVAAEMGDD